jgi:hypothetical protein
MSYRSGFTIKNSFSPIHQSKMNNISQLGTQAKEKSVSFASSFGEKAAEAFGDKVQNTLEKAVSDLKPVIQDSATNSSAQVKEGLMHLGECLKLTGVEGFTEWGFAIERGFAQLGQNLETGMYNGVRQINNTLQQQIDKSALAFSSEMKDTITDSSKNLATIGVEQIAAFKKVFEREIQIFIYCMIVCTVSLCIIATSFLFQLSPFREIYEYVAIHFHLVLFLAFAALAAFSIRRDQLKYPFLMIGGCGFFIGSLVQKVTFGSLNSIVLVCVFVGFVLLMQKPVLIYLVGKLKVMWGVVKEYREFKAEKMEQSAGRSETTIN